MKPGERQALQSALRQVRGARHALTVAEVLGDPDQLPGTNPAEAERKDLIRIEQALYRRLAGRTA